MKRLFYYICYVGIILLIVSCSSPSKLYNRGDYYRACIESIKKLRSTPDKADVQDILKQAYPVAVKNGLRIINNYSTSSDINRFDIMIEQVNLLNNLAQEIYTCPKANELIPKPNEFYSDLKQIKEDAAHFFYHLGLKSLENNTVEQARLAYTYFNKTNQYVNNYEDVTNKLSESLYAATLRVVVLPPIMPERYTLTADFFYNNLLAEISQSTKNKYVRFYSPTEASRENMKNPHQYMALDFIDYSIGNVRETKDTKEVKRDSVIVGTVVVDGATYNAYGTVKANFSRFTREVISGGKLQVKITDANTKRVITQKAFDGSYVWTSVWATFMGDERALNNEQLKLLKLQPTMPPSNQDMFVEFTKPIYNQVVSYVYSRYGK